MCMIASSLGKKFGVIATDSSVFSTETQQTSFEAQKLSLWKNKYWVTFLGTNLYFSRIDMERFSDKMDNLSLYLQGYLKGIMPDVETMMKEGIPDPDENKPYFCLYVLGLHGKRPMLAQFNSFTDFKPKYLWNDGEGLKFSTVIYGDDSIPGKAEIFKESTKFMELKSQELLGDKSLEVSPGLAGEILTRGIYHKADLEMQIGLKKKYAGGVVNVAGINDDGTVFSLSGFEVINGSR